MTLRRIALWALIGYALSLTVIVASVTVRRGGATYVLEKVGFSKPRQTYANTSIKDIERFKLYPSSEGKTVFLGDSITAQTNWAEYFSDIQNRGIGAETSRDVLNRVDLISVSRPHRIFLNIGTNDLATEIELADIVGNIGSIAKRIHADSPNTKVYVVSVLPNNPDFMKSALMLEKVESIKELNRLLSQTATSLDVRFIDIYPRFIDDRGYLKRDLTVDGTHLSEKGKRLYATSLAPFVR